MLMIRDKTKCLGTIDQDKVGGLQIAPRSGSPFWNKHFEPKKRESWISDQLVIWKVQEAVKKAGQELPKGFDWVGKDIKEGFPAWARQNMKNWTGLMVGCNSDFDCFVSWCSCCFPCFFMFFSLFFPTVLAHKSNKSKPPKPSKNKQNAPERMPWAIQLCKLKSWRSPKRSFQRCRGNKDAMKILAWLGGSEKKRCPR